MATRKALRQAIDRVLRSVHGSPTATRTATGGSTTTLVDTARNEADSFWANYWLYIATTTDTAAPQDEEALVTAFSAANDTITFSPAMTAAVGSGDTYELRRFFAPSSIHQAINEAIETCRVHFPAIAADETTVVKTDIFEYTLSSTIQDIHRIDLISHDVKAHGTATSGAATTLTDTSKSWTTNEWAGYEVAVYDGTGAGQYRTISSNTATALTVSVAWTTNPASGSEYKIKDVAITPMSQRLTYYEYSNNVLYLNHTLPEGQRLRITYGAAHSALSTDAATTSIPEVLVVNYALSNLLENAPLVFPTDEMARRASSVARAKWDAAQRFIQANGGKHSSRTFLNRGPTGRKTWWGGSEPTIGSREGQ